MKYRLVLLILLNGYFNIQAQPLQVKRIKDISPGSSDASQPYGFFEFNQKVYFGAGDNVHGSELWVSDGTENGTHIVADLDPGIYSYYPKSFANFNGRLYFNTYSNNYLDKGNIWYTDGTANGTVWVDSLYIFENIVNTGNMLLCIGTHDPYPFFKGGIYKSQQQPFGSIS